MTDSVRAPTFLAVGQLFLDMSFSGLPSAPRLGEEHWTADFGWGAGGIANQAICAARLGARTAIHAATGADPLSQLCTAALGREGIDITGLRRVDGWNLPVTAALGFGGDRALVTGGTPTPLGSGDLVDASAHADVATIHLDDTAQNWVRQSSVRGTRVFADLGWDDTGVWSAATLDSLDGCFAFLPNEGEARAYTRTDNALAAARALAERVPLSVVTRGGDGVVAVDAASTEEVVIAPVVVTAVDATGAGDVFGAALAVATGAAHLGWTLRQRLDFAVLVAAITVSRPGGASTAPRTDELVPWLDAHPGASEPARFDYLRAALAGGRSSSLFSSARS